MHWQTHTVFNQPTPLNNSNLFLSDTALREAVVREGAGWDGDLLASIGQQLGTAESLELGRRPTAIRRSCCAMTPPAPGRALPSARHLLMQGLCANRVHNLAGRRMPAKARLSPAPPAFCSMPVEAGTLCRLP